MRLRADEPTLPPILTVDEMEPVAKEYFKKPSGVSAETLCAFQREWQTCRDRVESKITSLMLYNISKWAKEKMKGYHPPAGWIQKLPMKPTGMSEEERYLFLFQEPEEGFALPSHLPIVFRRLMVGVLYDTQANNIIRIYVTIRGWKEE